MFMLLFKRKKNQSERRSVEPTTYRPFMDSIMKFGDLHLCYIHDNPASTYLSISFDGIISLYVDNGSVFVAARSRFFRAVFPDKMQRKEKTTL